MPEKTYYSQFFVLVCNKYDIETLTKREKMIFEGLKKEWCQDQNDPEGQRFHVIFLHKDDSKRMHKPDVKAKFAPLGLADRFSKLYFVGFGRSKDAGATAYIESDKVYGRETKDGVKWDHHQFFPPELMLLLKTFIQDPQVLIPRDQATCAQLLEPQRKFKLRITSCNAAVKNPETNNSLAELMFEAAFNGGKDILNCDVVASNAVLVPIPTKPYSMLSALQFLSPYFESLPVDGFHKRYLLDPVGLDSKYNFGFTGKYGFKIFRMLPSYKPSDEYKLTLIVSQATTQADISEASISPKTLTVSEANKYFQDNVEAETANPKANLNKGKGNN